MKRYKSKKFKLTYIKIILKIYKLTRNILPGLSKKIKLYLEKESLKNIKELNEFINKNNIK